MHLVQRRAGAFTHQDMDDVLGVVLAGASGPPRLGEDGGRLGHGRQPTGGWGRAPRPETIPPGVGADPHALATNPHRPGTPPPRKPPPPRPDPLLAHTAAPALHH